MDKKPVWEALKNLDFACRQFRDAYSDRPGPHNDDHGERHAWLEQCVNDLRECIAELSHAKAEGR